MPGLAELVLSRAGVNPAHYRDLPLSRRVAACLRALKVPTEGAARARLDADPTANQTALDALLIGVSGFFRDRPVFDALNADAIPLLAAFPKIRVLSVGCSTGTELTSVAMMMADAGLLERSEFVGVDCRPGAIAEASRAEFSDAAMRAVGADRRQRYVTLAPGGWRLSPSLRERMSWHQLDATAGLPAGPWHVILCRNLFIYLTPAISNHLLAAIVEGLTPGGVLVLGKAEPLTGRDDFTLVSRCVYRKHGL